jgi:uncharacterized protein (TIGR02246 family)
MSNEAADDDRAIRDLVRTWMNASKSGDLSIVLSLIAEDAIFMVPGRAPFGKDAFAAASQGQSNVKFDGTSDIQEIQIHGDWAFLRNHITLTITTSDGQSNQRSGYTLAILRKLPSGKWVLFRDANLMTST